MLSSAQKDIDAVGSFEKLNFLMFVTPDQGDNDKLGFFSLEIIHSSGTEEVTKLLLLQLLSFAVARSISLVVRGVAQGVSILDERIFISVTQNNLKIAAHGRTQLLQLAGVRRENRNVATFVDALADHMPHQGMDHCHLPVIRL